MSDDRRGGPGGQGQYGQGGQQGGHGGNGHQDVPSDLGQKVDWMAFSHQALYDMVHTGVDLQAAGSAQANWASVGKALGEVQELLAKAIAQSQQAWAGESADLAREALESVEKWALHTSDHAENVAKCIGDEIQHVQTAREMMPAPVPAPPVVEPVAGAPGGSAGAAGAAAGGAIGAQPQADTRTPPALRPPSPGSHGLATDVGFAPVGGAGTAPRGAVPSSPFTGLESVSAPVVDSVLTADATHRQAAEVMAMFQQNSYAVDRTVPSFSPPTNPVAPPPPVVQPTPVPVPVTPPVDGGPGVVPTSPQQQQQQQQSSERGATTSQHQQRGRAGGGGGLGGFPSGRRGMPVPIGASGGGGGGGSAPLGSPGSTSGTLGAEPGGRAAAGANPGSVTGQFQSAKAVTPHSGMIGAAPIAAPPPLAASPGGGANERSRPGYLEDDDNVFGVDRKAAPPVIGL
ncbi:PPE domain-containing protein [Saccharothrix australiensis]|uniref:PPE family protein n=1 Tax=Saccharothrix australiensis TaxID=2072 RepID=A0A495VTK0_9PSEU|nr:PPE domain-containing protein [Saccharothrix australiensis]RKT52027.1 PPE family protein [Saccharothrix australiensis]